VDRPASFENVCGSWIVHRRNLILRDGSKVCCDESPTALVLLEPRINRVYAEFIKSILMDGCRPAFYNYYSSLATFWHKFRTVTHIVLVYRCNDRRSLSFLCFSTLLSDSTRSTKKERPLIL
jgi:hypothetical protein